MHAKARGGTGTIGRIVVIPRVVIGQDPAHLYRDGHTRICGKLSKHRGRILRIHADHEAAGGLRVEKQVCHVKRHARKVG